MAISWYSSKTVVVTGASSGIGFEMAQELVRAKARVIVCGADKARLQRCVEILKSFNAGEVLAASADLSNQKELKDMTLEIRSWGQVDVLINNAGFGFMGDLPSMPEDRMMKMGQVNMMAVANLLQAFVPGMKERRQGGILNVGSVASFFATPGSSFYGATKYFVRGLTEGLHAELSGYGIHVTGLYPGTTNTGFLKRATDGRKDQWEKGMDPAAVAHLGLLGLSQNQLQVIPGIVNQGMVLASKILPAEFLLAVAQKRLSVQTR